jgi:hypothetical protein
MTPSLRCLLAIAPIAGIIVACGNAPETTSQSASQDPLMIAGGDLAPPPVKRLPPPPPPPPPQPAACMSTCTDLPQCSFGYSYEDSGDPTQKTLGCSPVYRYMNGANSGILGGVGSFCPDTPDNRQYLHDHNYSGFTSGYCDTCLNVPCGKIFVFWSYFIGPSCPSSCVVGKGGDPI